MHPKMHDLARARIREQYTDQIRVTVLTWAESTLGLAERRGETFQGLALKAIHQKRKSDPIMARAMIGSVAKARRNGSFRDRCRLARIACQETGEVSGYSLLPPSHPALKTTYKLLISSDTKRPGRSSTRYRYSAIPREFRDQPVIPIPIHKRINCTSSWLPEPISPALRGAMADELKRLSDKAKSGESPVSFSHPTVGQWTYGWAKWNGGIEQEYVQIQQKDGVASFEAKSVW